MNPTTSPIKKSKIFWAVDTTQNPKDAKNLIYELKAWAKHLGCDIQPISIFSESLINFPIELTASWKEKLEEGARKSMALYLKKAQTKGFLAPELVFTNTLSKRTIAKELAEYAEKQNALMIFANTRAKKTWNPFRLGGFAETLAATSRVPVLLLNHSAKPSTKISNILFPTDFGLDAKNALLRLEPWAKAFKSKVILYNQVETPNVFPLEYNSMWPTQTFNIELMMKDVEKARKKKANQWAGLLKQKNIECVQLVQRQKKYIAAEIIDIAKKHKVELIAMASQSGPVAQTILVSTARDVLLKAKCPVLIFYRPKAVRTQVTESKPVVSKKYLEQAEVVTQPEA